MKKNLALLLVVAMALTAMIGLVPASAAESTTPSQEIALFNISIKVGPVLLMAVPADGYTVKDGTVENLSMFIWEEDQAQGLTMFDKRDSAKGTVLSAQGTITQDDKQYLVFVYTGLAASQMSESVYARVMYTTPSGFRSYGRVYEYSVAEYANAYLNAANKNHKNLVETLVNYGHFAADYAGKTSYTAEEVKALKKVSVNYTLNGTQLGSDVQLVKAGVETTLRAPFVQEAKGVAPTWSVAGGKITTSTDTTVTASYQSHLLASYSHEAYTASDKSYDVLGSYVSATHPGNPTDAKNKYTVAGSNGQNSGTYLTVPGINLGNNFNSSDHDAFTYAKFQICGDENNQYVKFSHNGAAESKYTAFLTSSSYTGVGESMGFTLEVELMSGKDGTFPTTSFSIYGQGDASAANKGGSPALFYLNSDGSVTLAGTAVQYGNLKTNVIATSISQTEFQKVSVYVDFANGLMFGYLDGELTAVSGLHSNWNGTNFLAGYDLNKNTRFQVRLYGGYAASNWFTSKKFTAQGEAAKAASVILNGVETPLYDAETDTWNPAAIEKYVDDNYYFYYDDVAIYYGSLYGN